jgi:hypothetical protein
MHNQFTTWHTRTTKVTQLKIREKGYVTLNANTQASSVLASEVWLTSRFARSRSPSSPEVYTILSHLITSAQTGGEREPERGG